MKNQKSNLAWHPTKVQLFLAPHKNAILPSTLQKPNLVWHLTKGQQCLMHIRNPIFIGNTSGIIPHALAITLHA